MAESDYWSQETNSFVESESLYFHSNQESNESAFDMEEIRTAKGFNIDVSDRVIEESDIHPHSKSDGPIHVSLHRCPEVCDLQMLGGIPQMDTLHVRKCKKLRGLDALHHHESLRELWVSECDVSDEDVIHIGSIHTLEVLHISNCTAIKNVSFIDKLSELREIHLCGTAITDSEVRYFQNNKLLTSINLKNCVSLTDVSPLGSVLYLEELDLCECTSVKNIGDLGSLPFLKKLILTCTAITDTEVQSIGLSKTLEILNISKCDRLTDISPLAFVLSMEELNASGCSHLRTIGDLGALPRLKKLQMADTLILNENVCAISKSRTVEKLDISFCRHVTDASSLSSLVSLKRLDIIDCEKLKTIGTLSTLSSLTFLNISLTEITNNEVRYIGESRTLVKLYMYRCEMVTDVSPLASVLSLEKVDLSFCENLETIGWLGELPNLSTLYVSSTSITDADILSLGKSRTLVKIHMKKCTFVTDISPLASVLSLEKLDAYDCENLKIIGSLGTLPKLTVLLLSTTAIMNESVESIGESRTLVKLYMQGCPNVKKVSPLLSIWSLEKIKLTGCSRLKSIGALSSLLYLTVLWISNTLIKNTDIQSIGKSRTLVELYAKECVNVTDISPLASVCSLEKLNVVGCANLTTIGALGSLPHLTVLCMSCTAITNDAVLSIGESRSLVELRMEQCMNLTEVSSLVSVHSMQILRLNNCKNLTTIGAIDTMPKLIVLRLKNTSITDECVHIIGKSQTLVKLHIQGCMNVTDISPLASMGTLKTLRLTNCINLRTIGDVGKGDSQTKIRGIDLKKYS